MSQLLLYIIMGAVAGGVAGAILKLAGPRIGAASPNPNWQRLGAPAVAAAIALIVFIAGIGLFGGSSDRASQELVEFRQNRMVQVLERYQPGAREQIDAAFRDAIGKNDPNLLQARMMRLMQQYFPQYVARTSDEAIVRFAQSSMEVMNYLASKDVQTCARLATGGNLAADLPRDRMDAPLNAMADVIEDAANKPQAPPDPARAQSLVQDVITKLYAGNDPKLASIEMMMTPQNAPPDKLCYTMQRFYGMVLKLPQPDASVVLRQMVSSTIK